MRIVENLLQEGFVFVPVQEDLETLHTHCHEAFDRFRRLDRAVKDRFTIIPRGVMRRDGLPHEEPDLGYIPRGGEERMGGGTYDSKDIWHFDENLRGYFDTELIAAHPEVVVLLESSAAVYGVYRNVLHQVNEAFAESALLPQSFDDVFRNSCMFDTQMLLRLLAYTVKRSEDGIVGQEHQDRCTFTLHGYQNEGALEVLINDRWVTIDHPANSILVFPSMKAGLATGGILVEERRCVEGGFLRPFWHRGRSNNHTALEETPRRVVVAFFHHVPEVLF